MKSLQLSTDSDSKSLIKVSLVAKKDTGELIKFFQVNNQITPYSNRFILEKKGQRKKLLK